MTKYVLEEVIIMPSYFYEYFGIPKTNEEVQAEHFMEEGFVKEMGKAKRGPAKGSKYMRSLSSVVPLK